MLEEKTMPKVLTVSEVAERLRVSELTVYRLIRVREIPAYKVGALWRIDEEDLENYIQAQKAKNARQGVVDQE